MGTSAAPSECQSQVHRDDKHARTELFGDPVHELESPRVYDKVIRERCELRRAEARIRQLHQAPPGGLSQRSHVCFC